MYLAVLPPPALTDRPVTRQPHPGLVDEPAVTLELPDGLVETHHRAIPTVGPGRIAVGEGGNETRGFLAARGNAGLQSADRVGEGFVRVEIVGDEIG